MSPDSLALTVQLISAVGVVASIMYLAIQIRQNTRSERSSTQQQLTERIHNRLLLVATNSDLAALITADWETTEFSDVEKTQIGYWLAAIITDIKGIYAQYKLGLVTKETLENRITIIKNGVFKTEQGVAAWNNIKRDADPAFIKWFERNIING